MSPKALAIVVLAAGACLTRAKWSPEADLKACPLYPEHQPFKEPQVTSSSKVTLRVETITLCSPVSGRAWKTRAYSCQSCKDKSPSVPGVTIMTAPGADLYITLENALENPNPSPEDIKKVWAKHKPNKNEAYEREHVHNLGYLNCTSLHTHGLHISPQRQKQVHGVTYLRDTIFTEVCPHSKPSEYYFPIRSDHLGGTHWYHPHHHHATAVQAGGGLHGALIVQDPRSTIPDEIQNMPTITAVISLVDLRSKLTQSFSGVGLLEKQGGGGLWKNLGGPEKGQYISEDSMFALVNGMYRPQLELLTGHWYRFRFVFAAVEDFIQARADMTKDKGCEYRLLGKDGIWLNVAPRKIDHIYLAPGNRADVAIKCECKTAPCEIGFYAMDTDPTVQGQSLKQRQAEIDATINPSGGLATHILTQELMWFRLSRPKSGVPDPELREFSVLRPCYLVDLRSVDVSAKNMGRIDFWSPMDVPDSTWRVTWSDWYNKFKGVEMDTMEAPSVFELNVGEVYQLLVRGPVVKKGGIAQHPLHLHTIPYQITSLVTMDPYFLVGDWHDTLLHTAGQAVIKIHTDTYTGRYIIHCHILTHEDYGMMTFFDIKGQDGTMWSGAEQIDPTCYREGGKPGWKWASETNKQGDTGLPEKPHWVKGPPGYDCHRTCSPYGGCNSMNWPASEVELNSVVSSTGSHCQPSGFFHGPSKQGYNPSMDMWGRCSWEFQAYFSSSSVPDGNYRCGKTPPFNVARFCPCNKAITEGAAAHGHYL